MSDLISREALKENIEYLKLINYDNSGFSKIHNNAIQSCIEEIDNAPAVDIKDQIAGAYNEGYMCGNKEAEKARPQGEWIKITKNGTIPVEYICSVCGRKIGGVDNGKQ